MVVVAPDATGFGVAVMTRDGAVLVGVRFLVGVFGIGATVFTAGFIGVVVATVVVAFLSAGLVTALAVGFLVVMVTRLVMSCPSWLAQVRVYAVVLNKAGVTNVALVPRA